MVANPIILHFLCSSAASQRAQAQVADRHQIDDMEGNNARSTAATSPAAPARSSTVSASSDDLGPLPPGWQMSRTENERSFFIDHINKRTTWVTNEGKTRRVLGKLLSFRSIPELANQVLNYQLHVTPNNLDHYRYDSFDRKGQSIGFLF